MSEEQNIEQYTEDSSQPIENKNISELLITNQKLPTNFRLYNIS